jgi:hypothetical protein
MLAFANVTLRYRSGVPTMTRVRSPNYPSISLAEAVNRVGQVFAKERQHPAPKDVIVKHLGYNSLNGASLGALSALAKYGLLDREGEQYKVSDRAIVILHPRTPQEKNEALRAAAVAPALFAELLDTFKGVLPSDDNLRAYLIRRGFAESAISPVITTLRETMELVATEAEGYSPPGPTPRGQSAVQAQGVTSSAPPPKPAFRPSDNDFRVSLSDWGLEITAGLIDQVGVDRLMAILQATKALLPAKAEIGATESKDPTEPPGADEDIAH